MDKQIREAIDRGDFQNLAGRGKPLDLSENPFTPSDWRMAYRLLRDAGVSPDWIEQDKEIRSELRALVERMERRARALAARAAKTKTLAPDKMIAEHKQIGRDRERVRAELREQAIALNRQIDTFNLKAPSSRLHHARIRIDQMLEEFLKASR